MEKEIWKDVIGYEGLYQISNTGRIKSLEKYVKNHNKLLKKSEKILKPQIIKKGYLRIGLSKENVSKKFLIHRLVAETFIPNPNNKPQVNHKNRYKN